METLPPDHIRLLVIEPAGAGAVTSSPIRCRLQSTPLESAPPYEALSYNWGSVSQDRTLTCNAKPVSVTQNLWDAIQNLRDPQRERLMWIDMLCIDQSNQQERAEQVGIMSRIFHRAVRTIVWLGSSESEGEDVVGKAFELFELFEAYHKKWDVWDLPWALGNEYLPPMEPAEDSKWDPRWIALARLFQRPWFMRVWVIQEVAVRTISLISNITYFVEAQHFQTVLEVEMMK
jgi:hypothetical protein